MNPGEPQETPYAENPEIYALLGKFMVQFQSFCLDMQLGIILISKFNGQGSGLALSTLTAEMTALPLLKSLNSLARGMRELTDLEDAIISKIFDRAKELIESRNKFIHGQWFLSEPNEDGVQTFPGPGFQTKHTKKNGVQKVSLSVTKEDFQPLIAECMEVSLLIRRLALCFVPKADFSKNFEMDERGKISVLPANIPDFDGWQFNTDQRT